MNIFEKRPLCMILCIMLAVFSLFVNFSSVTSIIILCILIPLIAILIILQRKIKTSAIICVLSVCIFISVLLSLFFNLFAFPTKYHEKEVEVVATVTEIDHTAPSYSSATVKSHSLNGNTARYHITFIGSKELLSGIGVGDKVKLRGIICSVDKLDRESKGYYLSEKITARLDDLSACEYLSHKENPLAIFKKASNFISSKLKLYTNKETGGFLSALLIGEKEDLDPNTSLNFKRVGISHILALSGMHLAILSGFIFLVLRKLKLNKKLSSSIVIAFTIIYMALTGFTPSVSRAGLMLIIYNLLYLSGYCRDGLTNLTISVFLILVINPFCVYSLSLWLSALATLGILCYTELFSVEKKRNKGIKRIIRCFLVALSLSCFANFSTILLTVLTFGKISVLAPFSTLLFSFLIEILIYLGILTLAVGSFIPIGKLTVIYSDFIKLLVEYLSKIKISQVNSDFILIKLFAIIFSIAFILFLILNIKRKRIYLTLLFILFGSIFLIGAGADIISRKEEYISYYDGNILVKSGGQAYIIDNCDSTPNNASATIYHLNYNKITYLDGYILTSCSYKNEERIFDFLGKVKIDKLYLPIPKGSFEEEVAQKIANKLSLYGTGLKFYYERTPMPLGNVEYKLILRSYYTPSSTDINSIYSIDIYEKRTVYISDLPDERFKDCFTGIALSTDNLILGKKLNVFPYMLPRVEKVVYEKDGLSALLSYYTEKGASIINPEAPIKLYVK